MTMILQPAAGAASVRRIEFGRICVVLGANSGKFPEANMIMVHGSDTLAAIDAPLVSTRIGAGFDDTDLVIMSHAHEDHMAGLHRVPGAAVQVHRADLSSIRSWDGMAAAYGLDGDVIASMLVSFRRDFHYQPQPSATGFDDGATWDLGGVRIEAIHLPGHTAGHSALLAPSEGVLFVGDVDLSSFGPYYGDASSSLAEFRRSLAALPNIPARVWVTAHHRGIYTDRDAFLRDLAAYVAKLQEREDRLVDLLRQSPRTLGELATARILYPDRFHAAWVDGVERRTIARHLQEMSAAGRLGVDEEGRYRLV